MKATPEGITRAKQELRLLGKTQTKFVEEVASSLEADGGMSRGTLHNFFTRKSIRPETFKAICAALKLEWKDIADRPDESPKPDDPETPKSTDIADLVKEARDKISPYIQKQCGEMRVLDMPQPIGLEDIYTELRFLEQLTANQTLDPDKSLADFRGNSEAFDRFGLGKTIEEPVPGLKAVESHRKLMVLGRPGAGKTTFLKYLALRCDAGADFSNKVPFFVTLKDFAETRERPDMLNYLVQLTKVDDINVLQRVLEHGRALILLDGLDEVREENSDWMIRQVRDFAERFKDNWIVLTCRVAAKRYDVQYFTLVEIADFNLDQIDTFAEKWVWRKNLSKEKFLDCLKANPRIEALAKNPLLLTLLCLIFNERGKFNENRVELYGEGIRLLLEKWDNNRAKNQVYKNLSTDRKKDLLSELAFDTFVRGDYLFEKEEAVSYIDKYICNLPKVQTNSKAEKEKILRSIEAQHGLLTERAVGIYSFSHLTFHEYFTAREIKLTTRFDTLVDHITQKRWREVFLLTAGMLRQADDLVQRMKERIDSLLESDEMLQDVLVEVQQKSSDVNDSDKSIAIRTFYFALAQNQDYVYDMFDSLAEDLDLARNLALALCHNQHRIGALTQVRGNESKLGIDEIKLAYTPDLDRSHAKALDRFIGDVLKRALVLVSDVQEHLTDKGVQLHILSYAHTLDQALPLDPQMQDKLQALRNDLQDAFPEDREAFLKVLQRDDSSKDQKDYFSEWWRQNSRDWIERLEAVLSDYGKIGHKWQFSREQKQLLQQYCDANQLLIDCLESDCYVSRSTRQEIEEKLLLPSAEIKKMKGSPIS